MLQKLQSLFGSVTKSLDILYVLEGVKPCSRIMAHEDELGKILDFFIESNIKTAISDFKVVKRNIQSRYYSDKSIKIDKNEHRKGYYLVYLSKNNPDNAKNAEESNNHVKFGLELGYPKCCCEFFSGNFNENSSDLTLNILKNSKGFEFRFYTNIAARHFDINLLSHFPHGFECGESIKIAKNNLGIIEKYSSETAALFKDNLATAVLYTESKGIFLLKDPKKINDEVSFGKVIGTAKNELSESLELSRKIVVINKNKLRVGNIVIGGNNTGFMIFK